jgi:hypothetical protein
MAENGRLPFFNASSWELYAHLFGILDLILPLDFEKLMWGIPNSCRRSLKCLRMRNQMEIGARIKG